MSSDRYTSWACKGAVGAGFCTFSAGGNLMHPYGDARCDVHPETMLCNTWPTVTVNSPGNEDDVFVVEHISKLDWAIGKMLYVVRKGHQHERGMKQFIERAGVLSGAVYHATAKCWTLSFEGDVPNMNLVTRTATEHEWDNFWYYVRDPNLVPREVQESKEASLPALEGVTRAKQVLAHYFDEERHPSPHDRLVEIRALLDRVDTSTVR